MPVNQSDDRSLIMSGNTSICLEKQRRKFWTTFRHDSGKRLLTASSVVAGNHVSVWRCIGGSILVASGKEISR
jgi:hypothetical protein